MNPDKMPGRDSNLEFRLHRANVAFCRDDSSISSRILLLNN